MYATALPTYNNAIGRREDRDDPNTTALEITQEILVTRKRPIETDSLTGSVYFDPSAMTVDQPYAFRFSGHPFTVIKRTTGDIDVYYLP